MEETIGLIAGILTTGAALPQIWKTWKSKNVKDISPRMFWTLAIGVLLWTVYGIIKKDVPIILTNGISVVFNTLMLISIYSYRKSNSSMPKT